MKSWPIKLATAAGVALLAGLAFAGPASAALIINCDGSDGAVDLLSRVSGSTDCQYLAPADPSNSATAANVNTAAFFGIADWSIVPAYAQSPGGLSGSWDLGSLLPGGTYMITFKSGQGTNLTSFLISSALGSWTTPFSDPPFDLPGASRASSVGEFSIFTHGVTQQVPEPVSLLLLGLGLVVLRGTVKGRSE
ncbi:MAG TPA: PEP-CTERM sorting domain-containing protein [Burkholderiaceae bacterium]|nr:PEP-CTERM sorting domain-containing protein [Burkholderiaceae bacterium]